MNESMMIFQTSPSADKPEPDVPAICDWIQSPAQRKAIEIYLGKGYTLQEEGFGPLDYFRINVKQMRWAWAYYGKDGQGAMVMRPIRPVQTPPPPPPSPAEINAFFGSILRLLTAFMACGRPIQDLHLPGGGNITIPRWFLDAMRALGLNVHVDEEEDSWAEPRPERVID